MNNNEKENKEDLLIDLLLDNTARIDERDDAAMDLAEYGNQKALNALFLVATNINEDPIILDSCGASIAAILVEMENCDKKLIEQLAPVAKDAAYMLLFGQQNQNG